MIKLEHANLSVTDVEATTRFMRAALPELTIRGEGRDDRGRPWRHVGNEHFYVALQGVDGAMTRQPYGDSVGLNHLGWQVDDAGEVEARMRAAGFEPNLRIDDHPARRRVYFHDPDGNDWEFVEYLTEDLAARNSYER